jgi:hypothetical protein
MLAWSLAWTADMSCAEPDAGTSMLMSAAEHTIDLQTFMNIILPSGPCGRTQGSGALSRTILFSETDVFEPGEGPGDVTTARFETRFYRVAQGAPGGITGGYVSFG